MPLGYYAVWMRGNPIITIVAWVVYFGLTVAIILIDRNIQQRRAAAQGSVDFMDRSPASYLVLAIFCGPAPLIVYFGVTRKSALGWLMGIGAAIAVYAGTLFAVILMTLATSAAGVSGLPR